LPYNNPSNLTNIANLLRLYAQEDEGLAIDAIGWVVGNGYSGE
jgi:hypothetical protein